MSSTMTGTVLCLLALWASPAHGLGLQINEAGEKGEKDLSEKEVGAGAGSGTAEVEADMQAKALAQARVDQAKQYYYSTKEAEAYKLEEAHGLQEGAVQERVLEAGPLWTVREYNPHPVQKAKPLSPKDRRIAEDALKRAEEKERLAPLREERAEEMQEIKAKAKSSIMEFGKQELQKMKDRAVQRKLEKQEMAAEEQSRKSWIKKHEQSQAAQDKRVDDDLKRKEKLLREGELANRRKEEMHSAAALKNEAAKLKLKRKEEHHIEHTKKVGHNNYVRATPGKDCPHGWTVVDTDVACRSAALVLGGTDEISLHKVWKDRPYGCFWHILNGQVNFNAVKGGEKYSDSTPGEAGRLNEMDERICTKLEGVRVGRVSFTEEEEDVEKAEAKLKKKMQRDQKVAEIKLNERNRKPIPEWKLVR